MRSRVPHCCVVRSNSTGKGSRRSQRRKSGANSSCNDSEPRADSASSSDHALPHTGSSCSLPMIGGECATFTCSEFRHKQKLPSDLRVSPPARPCYGTA
eukprot:1715209-Pleurochrysis_carterae.AAC.1